jgi:hypothetical protein
MLIDIFLGYKKEVCLTYQMHDNPVSELFYNRMKTQENNIISRTEFYNMGETQQDVENQLADIIEQIKQLNPDLLESDNISDLNTLHINFPKFHSLYNNAPTGSPLSDVYKQIHELLIQFNYRIHHLENKRLNRPQPKFLFACNDPGIDLPEPAYSLFTAEKKKGTMYMNYPHVGKHFMELWLDNDIEVPADQIQLTSKMANGVYCWLGDDIPCGNTGWRNMFRFYNKISHKLPAQWGDPKLTIGFLPLASVTHDVDLSEVAQNRYVHSWGCR